MAAEAAAAGAAVFLCLAAWCFLAGAEAEVSAAGAAAAAPCANETAAKKFAWINKIVAVGTGRREPAGPIYSVEEVL